MIEEKDFGFKPCDFIPHFGLKFREKRIQNILEQLIEELSSISGEGFNRPGKIPPNNYLSNYKLEKRSKNHERNLSLFNLYHKSWPVIFIGAYLGYKLIDSFID